MIWHIALGLAALFITVCVVLYVVQRRFIYFPEGRRPDIALAQIPNLREVLFPTADGLLLNGWYLPRPHGRPLILYFHGNSGN